MLKGLEHFAELADQQGAALVFRNRRDEIRAGLFGKRDQAQGNPGAAHGLRHQQGIKALTGDQHQRAGRIEIGGEKRGEHEKEKGGRAEKLKG